MDAIGHTNDSDAGMPVVQPYIHHFDRISLPTRAHPFALNYLQSSLLSLD